MSYEYRPTRQNYHAHLAVLAFLLLSVASFVGSAFLPKLPSLLQAVGVALLIPAIQLVARYLVVQYLYRVRVLDDGSVDLEIFLYRGGRQMQLVCCVGLDEIKGAAPLGKENCRAPKGLKRYSYCMDLAPQRALVLSISNMDGECEVMLAPDVHMSELLTKHRAPDTEKDEPLE